MIVARFAAGHWQPFVVVAAAVAAIVLLPFASYAKLFVGGVREPNWFESFATHHWVPRNSRCAVVDLLAARRHL